MIWYLTNQSATPIYPLKATFHSQNDEERFPLASETWPFVCCERQETLAYQGQQVIQTMRLSIKNCDWYIKGVYGDFETRIQMMRMSSMVIISTILYKLAYSKSKHCKLNKLH